MKGPFHFIGIGGIGMSGLAHILLKKGGVVTGSDLVASATIEKLRAQGAIVALGHAADQIQSEQTVVVSSGVPLGNCEYQAARKKGCTILHRSDLLQRLMHGRRSFAVAGTHGKTTTSALLSWVLLSAGMDPSFVVGGVMLPLNCSARSGESSFFVAEADESDGSFLKYRPEGAIVTNVGLDHLDHYQTEEQLLEAFHLFCQKVSSPDLFFYCGDDPRLKTMRLSGTAYGFSKGCSLKISRFSQKGWCTQFDLTYRGKHYPAVELALIGRYNALNGAAVFGLALALGLTEEVIREAFCTFGGVKRRCERIADRQQILLIDDYAHHPTEIASTLRALREAVRERRLIALFQPHRYSRLQGCFSGFYSAFSLADELIVTDIYSAGERPIPGIEAPLLAEKIDHPSVRYIPFGRVGKELLPLLKPHDVVVALGAGDANRILVELAEHIADSPPKWRIGIVSGGRSEEHAISLQSAQFFIDNLPKELYELTTFKIDLEGRWSDSRGRGSGPMISSAILKNLERCDLLFPILHGPFGEDGTVQGLFDLLDIPYIGCAQRAAAICMDKVLTKQLVQAAGVATPPFLAFSTDEWRLNAEVLTQKLQKEFTLPIFVKGPHLGSSIGISKVASWEQLELAVEGALRFDESVIIEQGIAGRECEFAILGNHWIEVFPPGEILTRGAVYDYAAKYGEKGMATAVRADLPKEVIDEGRALAERAYRATSCQGFARVDCFFDATGKWWFSEINPIPGFAPNSLYPKMCAVAGHSTADLIDRFVVLALHAHRRRSKMIPRLG